MLLRTRRLGINCWCREAARRICNPHCYRGMAQLNQLREITKRFCELLLVPYIDDSNLPITYSVLWPGKCDGRKQTHQASRVAAV